MYPVTASEWQDAKAYFDRYPDAVKLPYSALPSGKKQKNLHANFSRYPTAHSFIKIKGVIYAMMSKGDEIIGRGTFGTVRYLQEENGDLSAVKIVAENAFEPLEQSMLEARKLSKGSVFRKKPQPGKGSGLRNTPQLATGKYYIHMEYLGPSLTKVLKTPLTDDERFKLAIDLCVATHRFHHGLDDKDGVCYAHLDLKTDNVTRDKNGKLHLIDFGLISRNPATENINESPGSICYAPPITRQLNKLDYDTIAIQRSLWFPARLVDRVKLWNLITEQARDLSVLTQAMMDQHDLHPWINTDLDHRPDVNAFINNKSNPLILGAILINARNQLGFNPNILSKDAFLCLKLTELHQQNLSPVQMRQELKNMGDDITIQGKAMYIKQQLQLQTCDHSISLHAELVLRLTNKNMIAHLNDLCLYPRLATELMNRADNSPFAKAVFYLLSYKDVSTGARGQCFEEFCRHPELVNVERAMALYHQFANQRRETLTALQQNPKRTAKLRRKEAILHALTGYGVPQAELVYRALHTNQALCDLIIDDSHANLAFFRILSRHYTGSQHLTAEDRQMHQHVLQQAMRCKMEQWQMNRYWPIIQKNWEKVKAVNALFHAGCTNPDWLMRIGSPSNTVSGEMFTVVANWLAAQNAPLERYNACFAALLKLGEIPHKRLVNEWIAQIIKRPQLADVIANIVEKSASNPLISTSGLISLVMRCRDDMTDKLVNKPGFVDVIVNHYANGYENTIPGILQAAQGNKVDLWLQVLAAKPWPEPDYTAIVQAGPDFFRNLDETYTLENLVDAIHFVTNKTMPGFSLAPIRHIFTSSNECLTRARGCRYELASSAAKNHGLIVDFRTVHSDIRLPDAQDRLCKLVRLAGSNETAIKTAIRLCSELEKLWRKQTDFILRERFAERQATQQLIRAIESGIDTHLLYPADPTRNLVDRCADLRQSVAAVYTGEVRATLTRHRGIMGIIDRILSYLWHSERPPNTQYAFFKPAAAEQVDNMLEAMVPIAVNG